MSAAKHMAAASPASEAQAGWVMVPREPTPEMYGAGAMEIAMNMQRVMTAEQKSLYVWRAMLASAPLPASAAEGQKARPLWLQDNPAGAAERDRLEWKFIAKTLAECRARIEADGSRHSWLDAAENIAHERATPTASTADAADLLATLTQLCFVIRTGGDVLKACEGAEALISKTMGANHG